MVNNELVLLTVAIFIGVLSAILTAWIIRAGFLYLWGLLGYLFKRVEVFLQTKIAEYRSHAH